MIPRLSPARFVWAKYIAKIGFTLRQVMTDKDTLSPDCECVGWCPANLIAVRPRVTGFVVLVYFKEGEGQGEEFWFHLNNLPEGCQ